MSNPLRHWLNYAVMGGVVACASDLTLPGNEPPAAGAPAVLSAVSGDGQEGKVRSRLDEPLVVRVTDANSQPLAGIPISFRFKSEVSDAEVDPTDAATDSDGLAAAEVRLGADAGTHIVEARVAQAPSELSATFDLTAVAPNDKDKGKDGRDEDDDDDDDD
jgi:hypothetical protein